MIRIMIIDDEEEMLISLKKLLSRNNQYELELFQDGRKALDALAIGNYDGVICDLKMPSISGLEILKKVKSDYPDIFVIVISGYGTIESSVEAMRLGAFDFIEKPFTSKKLMNSLSRAFTGRNGSNSDSLEIDQLQKEFPDIIFVSEKMKDILEMVRKVASGQANVLITGESGTGKELIARSIHRLSKRAEFPFIPVNCAALPENLFESELFGYERGAFTGANRTKPGLVEFSDKGSFFLDEIGDLGLNLQVKLLRMLEERKIRRVGGKEEIPVDVRVISATNKNLEDIVSEKGLRKDLLYRLNTINIEVPPLRERPEDIQCLAEHFLDELRRKEDKNIFRIAEDAMESLINYHWPGNVRELQNIVTRAFYLCQGNDIRLEDLPPALYKNAEAILDKILHMPYREAKEQVLETFEQKYITNYLKKYNGNITRAADACGIDRRTMHRLINKYGIIYSAK